MLFEAARRIGCADRYFRVRGEVAFWIRFHGAVGNEALIALRVAWDVGMHGEIPIEDILVVSVREDSEYGYRAYEEEAARVIHENKYIS